ncbi:hypothetical protein TrVGV298_003586 [Trichoderma virens]|nr:hypothetical protein TrVGV298_003586 [Trichoderma virens]
MVDRPNKPSALAATPSLPPQAQVTISDGSSRVTAVLPTGESVEILLYGATVLSWKDASGDEKLWLSEGAKLDGTKAVRGGIPLVFPVFGTAPDHEATSKLPQHGFARNSRWEFLGKSSNESSSNSVKLDFGLSSENLDEAARQLWPYKFGLLYSVTLAPRELEHRAGDYQRRRCASLASRTPPFHDKVDGVKDKTQSSDPITFSGETDRVYTPVKGPGHPVVITDGGVAKFRVVRDNLDDVVVWNPWVDKSAGMGDFQPKDGWKNMVCVEAGAVSTWQKLEKGDAFEGAQTIYLN